MKIQKLLKSCLHCMLIMFSALSFLAYGQVLAESTSGVSEGEAIQVAKQVLPGKVIDVKLKAGFYLVKVMTTESKIVVVRVNQKTGIVAP